MRSRIWLLLSFPLLLPTGACLRVQLVPPVLLSRAAPSRAPRSPRVVPTRPGTTYPGGVALWHLTLDSPEADATSDEQEDFRQALSKTLAAAFPRRSKAHPPLRVDIRYRYRTKARRWLALDVLHAITLGFMFVTPVKGVAVVDVDLTVHRPAGPTGRARSYRATIRIRAPYKSAFTPWYNHTTRQKYLDQAHLVAFRKIVAHLRWWLGKGVTARRLRQLPRQAPPKKTAKARPAKKLIWYDLKLHVAGESKAVKRHWRSDTIVGHEQVKVTQRRTVLSKLLKLLGGLWVGYSYGSVWARSKVRDDSGRSYTIASGRGTTHGVGVSLHRPPQNSGVYFSPAVGFLWERFKIGDVAGIAQQNDAVGATDIPAIATDPDDPDRPELDLAAPWRYRLIMTSLHLGLRAGGVMVWGRKLQLYLGLEGGANLVEWRWMDVLWDSYRKRAHTFAGAGSFSGRLALGVTYRPWHLTLFVQGTYEYYRSFTYPEPIPFRGRMAYDPVLGVWQRPVQTAEALSLHALRINCGLAVIY